MEVFSYYMYGNIYYLAIVLSVLLRYTDSDCPFGIFKLFFMYNIFVFQLITCYGTNYYVRRFINGEPKYCMPYYNCGPGKFYKFLKKISKKWKCSSLLHVHVVRHI